MDKKDINKYIVCTKNVLGGRPHINGTRISVRAITYWYKKGYSPEEIVEQFEQLALFQIYAALTYYHANIKEIEDDIMEEENEYDRLFNEYNQYCMSA